MKEKWRKVPVWVNAQGAKAQKGAMWGPGHRVSEGQEVGNRVHVTQASVTWQGCGLWGVGRTLLGILGKTF